LILACSKLIRDVPILTLTFSPSVVGKETITALPSFPCNANLFVKSGSGITGSAHLNLTVAPPHLS